MAQHINLNSNDHHYITDGETEGIAREVELPANEDPPPFDVEKFKQSLMGDMVSLIRRELGEKRIRSEEDDTVSLHTDKYRAINDDNANAAQSEVYSEGTIPRADSLETNDNYSDLFQNKSCAKSVKATSQKSSTSKHDGPALDMSEEILSQVDKEMPATVELGLDIKENLAKRIVAQFKERSQKTFSQETALHWLFPRLILQYWG